MSFTPPPQDSWLKVDAAKARVEARRIAALGHEEVHRALGRELNETRPRKLRRRIVSLLTGTRNW